MHRHGRHDKFGGKKRDTNRPGGLAIDDVTDHTSKPIRPGRRNWQQERQLLQQLDLRNLDEYLLDQE